MIGLGVFVAIAIAVGCLLVVLKKKRRREDMQFLELKKRVPKQNCMYCRVYCKNTTFFSLIFFLVYQLKLLTAH